MQKAEFVKHRIRSFELFFFDRTKYAQSDNYQPVIFVKYQL